MQYIDGSEPMRVLHSDLNASHDQGGHGDVEQSQQQLDQLDSPGLVERLHLKHQQHEPS